ncbi:MAG TPA: hypothetical protein VGJ28_26775 [Micromonosporaceae bacterium]
MTTHTGSETTKDETIAHTLGAILLAGAVVVGIISGFHPATGQFEIVISLLLSGAILRFEEAIRGTFVSSVGRAARMIGAYAIGVGLLGDFVGLEHYHLLTGSLLLVVVGVLARLEGAVVERRRGRP